jgi:hypothetical protein
VGITKKVIGKFVTLSVSFLVLSSTAAAYQTATRADCERQQKLIMKVDEEGATKERCDQIEAVDQIDNAGGICKAIVYDDQTILARVYALCFPLEAK